MNGKEKCALLKSIRVRLAELNHITYTPHPCNNIDDCNGTCQRCDAESRWLLHTMKEMEIKGFPIAFSLNGIGKCDLDIDRNDCAGYTIDSEG